MEFDKHFPQHRDERNYYCHSHKYTKNESCMSECDYALANFGAFLEIVKKESEKGDARPIYIDGFFNRIDAAVDIVPTLYEFIKLRRPLFILS